MGFGVGGICHPPFMNLLIKKIRCSELVGSRFKEGQIFTIVIDEGVVGDDSSKFLKWIKMGFSGGGICHPPSIYSVLHISYLSNM